MTKSNEIAVVTIIAATKSGNKTLHFAPRNQKADESIMRDRARAAMRRFLARAGINYIGVTTKVEKMPSVQAKSKCVFKDPRSGNTRFAIC